MTQARYKKLCKRVETWQSYLVSLGVSHYNIEHIVVEENPDGNDQANASVTPSNYYDSAWFSFSTSFVDQCYERNDMAKLDRVIIHEWLHVAFQQFENAVELPHDYLSPIQASIWDDALNPLREQLIERLARQLYDAFGPDVVP